MVLAPKAELDLQSNPVVLQGSISCIFRNPNSTRERMMSTNAILRAAVLIAAALCLSLATGATVFGQDVGIDVGAGVFKAKNPESRRTTTKPATGTTRPASRTGTAKPNSNVAERVEELLDKGNEARDARKYTEAEDAY